MGGLTDWPLRSDAGVEPPGTRMSTGRRPAGVTPTEDARLDEAEGRNAASAATTRNGAATRRVRCPPPVDSRTSQSRVESIENDQSTIFAGLAVD